MSTLRRIAILGVVLALLALIGWQVDARRSLSLSGRQTSSSGLDPRGSGETNKVTPRVAPGQPLATPGSDFARLGLRERRLAVDEILKHDLNEILDLMLKAGREEHDLTKQLAIQTALSAEMRRRPPDPDFVRRLKQIVLRPNDSDVERGSERLLALGVLAAFPTRDTLDALLEMIPTFDTPEIKRAALDYLGRSGAIWDDGKFHDELSPALEKAWIQSSDKELLATLAKAMAALGAPKGVELLFTAAMGEGGIDPYRQECARDAMSLIFTSNALPPILARLSVTSPRSVANQTAALILARIGNEGAANALVRWVCASDATAATVVPDLVLHSGTPLMLEAWRAALAPEVAFRSEANREAVRRGLADYASRRRTDL